ncbi:glycogen synthase [Actinoplanes regularis]|uniref:glycogen synthase n=1 Tax=Actinoplanes regularis TaxID=52697 RepID=UPI0024A1719E|nr:glycogen synthase [Actinoplanes regularis]GLW35782.1 glycogen synthase [Actinoplanes regularis]
MYVVMLSPECAPVAQAGGLGEVVYGLSRELEIRGNAVEIILPKYACMRYDQIYGLCVSYRDLCVPWYGGVVPCTVWFGFVHGRKCYFIEPHSADGFFERGSYYGDDDDILRFAFFCKAAMEFLLHAGKRPDVVHCHDWQTALAPVLLFEQYQNRGLGTQRACLTMHNIRHQGRCGEEVLRATSLLPTGRFTVKERLADDQHPGALNLLKGGVVYANFVTSVSPQYAWESRWTDQGAGLSEALHRHAGKFGGVLNGVDYDVWNPETDELIPYNYSRKELAGKYADKRALRERFWLADSYRPIVAYVGRLDEQKGVDLIHHAAHSALDRGAQFVLLGSSTNPAVEERFRQLKWHLNDNPDCHLELQYTAELAHLVYAGSDLLIMPSLFEPCGLAQLIAMKYGTVPVVRAIGGLCDTVFDWEHSDQDRHLRNGFVFHQPDPAAVDSALHRAIGLWFHHPGEFRELMVNAMRADYSWSTPGRHYLNIYHHIRHK